MKLSIAMIIKNEEKTLERCLKSLIPLKNKIEHEIIIVDTGSTDNSLLIAKKYTDKVFQHQWNDNFSSMRNLSISYCKGDWILIIDADEVLENPDELISSLNADDLDKYNVLSVYQKNVYSDNSSDYSMISIFRCFKNNKDFRFEGVIHEQPNIYSPKKLTNITLWHDGYLQQDLYTTKNRYYRNMNLLKKQLNDDCNTKAYTLFQIAKTYSQNDIIKSAHYYKRAYDYANESNNSICYPYIWGAYSKNLLTLKLYNDAISIYNEISDYSRNDLDYYYVLGNSYYNNHNYDKAEKYFYEYLNLYKKKIAKEVPFSETGESTISSHDNIIVNYLKTKYHLKKYYDVVNIFQSIKNTMVKEETYYEYFIACVLVNKTKNIIKIINTSFSENLMDTLHKSFSYLYHTLKKTTDFLKEFMNINPILDTYINAYFYEKSELNYKIINFNTYYDWKSKILINYLENDDNAINILLTINCSDAQKYIFQLTGHFNCIDKVYTWVNNNYLSNDVNINILSSIIYQYLLSSNLFSNDKFEKLCLQSMVNNQVLCKLIIKDEYSTNLGNRFISNYELLWINIYGLINSDNKLIYIKALKNNVKDLPEYNKVVDFFFKKINKTITNDMILEKNNLINISEQLINNDQIDQASDILNSLLDLFPFDSKILLNKGICSILTNNFDEALLTLSLSYIFDNNKFDSCFNLAYVFELKKNIDLATYYYKKSLDYCNDTKLISEINSIINNL